VADVMDVTIVTILPTPYRLITIKKITAYVLFYVYIFPMTICADVSVVITVNFTKIYQPKLPNAGLC